MNFYKSGRFTKILALLLPIGAIAVGLHWADVQSIKCSSLNIDDIRVAAANYYVANHSKGSVSIADDSGKWNTYQKVEYRDEKEYLDIYPDCCRYYPKTIGGKRLTYFERVIDGKCGSVSLVAHAQYRKENQIVISDTASAHVWLVDNELKILEDEKER